MSADSCENVTQCDPGARWVRRDEAGRISVHTFRTARQRARKTASALVVGRVIAGLLAAGFGVAAYVYLSLPDVRLLRTTNPENTAFMELRAQQAR